MKLNRIIMASSKYHYYRAKIIIEAEDIEQNNIDYLMHEAMVKSVSKILLDYFDPMEIAVQENLNIEWYGVPKEPLIDTTGKKPVIF